MGFETERTQFAKAGRGGDRLASPSTKAQIQRSGRDDFPGRATLAARFPTP